MRKYSRIVAVALLTGIGLVGVAGTASATQNINCRPCYGCCVAPR
jgi:hypothetical protein